MVQGSGSDDPRAPDQGTGADAPPPAGDWTFQRGDQVFGPVSGVGLVELVEEGRVDARTRVRREGEAWRELGAVPELVPILREARTRARRAAEARRAETRARWNASARWTVWTLLIGGLVVVVAAGAAWLSVKRPWQDRNPLLADFGDITIGSPRVVEGRGREVPREVAVPDLRVTTERRRSGAGSGASARAERAAAPAGGEEAVRAGAGPGEGIVATRFDAARIEQVLARHRDRLADCVRAEARRSPEFVGAIPIEFAIGNDGHVVELWIDEPRFRSGPLRDCFFGVLRVAEFEPFLGQRPVVSLAFHVGAGAH